MRRILHRGSWRGRALLIAVIALSLVAGGGRPLADAPLTIVVCAPGYPGTTVDAQPTMDRFAAAVADATGWPATALRAEYHPTVDGGRDRIRAADTAIAVVPYALFWSEGDTLDLKPILQVARAHGSTETWTLVSGKGRVSGPDDLAAWEITGLPGFSPAFVREQVLAGWGALPSSTRVTFAPRIVTALRRATRGENVAVLLDPPQSDALPSLPFGAELEIIAHSPDLPGFLVCRVAGRLDDLRTAALRRALARLHKKKEGRETLESMRMTRFEDLNTLLATATGGGAPTR